MKKKHYENDIKCPGSEKVGYTMKVNQEQEDMAGNYTSIRVIGKKNQYIRIVKKWKELNKSCGYILHTKVQSK